MPFRAAPPFSGPRLRRLAPEDRDRLHRRDLGGGWMGQTQKNRTSYIILGTNSGPKIFLIRYPYSKEYDIFLGVKYLYRWEHEGFWKVE